MEITDSGNYVAVAVAPGRAVIQAVAVSQYGTTKSAERSVWIRGEKTPVILIHGRTSNSVATWGADSRILKNILDPKDPGNQHFAPDLYAYSQSNKSAQYIDKSSQDIINCDPTHDEGGNLVYYLKQQGYTENVDLFIFNYPNEDAVIHNALKLREYINNLTAFARESTFNKIKASFYQSEEDYNNNNYKVNLVCHSMGGLVARYYIENLGHDCHVDKLITICTPHWGSGYADTSCATGLEHVICDHDLRPESKMYGGSFSDELNCNAITTNCCDDGYTLTNELQYSKNRSTKYYAIAGIDYKINKLNENNVWFTLENCTTYAQLQSSINAQINHRLMEKDSEANANLNIRTVDDNLVGFLSQIGWTDNIGDSPNKKILFHKILVNIDTNGENGGGISFIELLGDKIFHNRVPHRICMMEKVLEYLNE